MICLECAEEVMTCPYCGTVSVIKECIDVFHYCKCDGCGKDFDEPCDERINPKEST